MNISIGLFAHNELDNLTASIKSILRQKLDDNWKIKEIVLVVSGSTDGTDVLAQKLAEKLPVITLIIEKKRSGKVSAVNKFLRASKSKILILTNADNSFGPGCFQHLLDSFKEKEVGMTCGHVIPKNGQDSFFDYASHLQWYLLHKMNLQFTNHVKAGELVAFRRIFHRINRAIPFDEASIEGLIRAQGFEIRYIPQAVVYNWGPDNWVDYMTLRKRNNAGHYVIRDGQGYKVSTMSGLKIFGVFVANFEYMKPKIWWAIAVIFLEIVARIWAWVDVVILKKQFSRWQRVHSAKKRISV